MHIKPFKMACNDDNIDFYNFYYLKTNAQHQKQIDNASHFKPFTVIYDALYMTHTQSHKLDKKYDYYADILMF